MRVSNCIIPPSDLWLRSARRVYLLWGLCQQTDPKVYNFIQPRIVRPVTTLWVIHAMYPHSGRMTVLSIIIIIIVIITQLKSKRFIVREFKTLASMSFGLRHCGHNYVKVPCVQTWHRQRRSREPKSWILERKSYNVYIYIYNTIIICIYIVTVLCISLSLSLYLYMYIYIYIYRRGSTIISTTYIS